MATIIENVRRKQDELRANGVLAGQNGQMAIDAIRDGVKSSAWEFYMAQFARDANGVLNEDQLARLTGQDKTLGDPILDRQRAYLIGNAFCTMSSTGDFDFGIESIDNTVTGIVAKFVAQPCEKARFPVVQRTPGIAAVQHAVQLAIRY